MRVKAYETKDYLLETVEDMISALMETPKGYTLNPLGQQCAMSINHYQKSVHLDDPNWIESFENELKEDIEANGDSFEFDVKDSELETYCLYYMWEATSETDGVYTYYSHEFNAKEAFDACESGEKTYGKAHFVDGKLEPYEVIGTTL